jgi:Tol biopolymer transport system component
MVTTSVYPRLNADGSMLSWRGLVDGQGVSWVAPTAEPFGRELCRNCLVVGFFPDDEHLLVDFGKRLSRVRVNDGDTTLVLELADRVVLDSDLSPDGRWLALQIGEPDGNVGLFVVPLAEIPVSPESFIEISTTPPWVGSPRWSTDQRFLYFISERDDFLCVWARQLDPVTKTPVGEEFAVAHAHSSDIKRMSFARQMWDIEVGGDRLVFNAGELTGDVYTAQLELDE